MPVAVQMPNSPRENSLDTIMKGLSIAKDVYGIYSDSKLLQQNKEALAAKTAAEQKKYEEEMALKNQEMGLKEKEFGLRERKQNLEEKTAMADLKKGPAKDLNAMQLQRLDNISMGINAVQGMKDALASGDWTVSPIGDNNYTMARRSFEEALGRMQSGGAINKEESARFRKMVPGPMDSSEIQQKKLQTMEAELASRAKNMGFSKEELLRKDIISTGRTGTAYASPIPDVNKMSEAELDAIINKHRGRIK